MLEDARLNHSCHRARRLRPRSLLTGYGKYQGLSLGRGPMEPGSCNPRAKVSAPPPAGVQCSIFNSFRDGPHCVMSRSLARKSSERHNDVSSKALDLTSVQRKRRGVWLSMDDEATAALAEQHWRCGQALNDAGPDRQPLLHPGDAPQGRLQRSTEVPRVKRAARDCDLAIAADVEDHRCRLSAPEHSFIETDVADLRQLVDLNHRERTIGPRLVRVQ